MRSENFDAACSQPEDELTLLSDIHKLITDGVDIKAGERQYDAVLREMMAMSGATYTAEDV